LDEALEASRSLAIDLSPPVLHELGLVGALKWLADRMKDQHDFAVTVHADVHAEPAAEDVRFLLFDCAREFLFNAVKHGAV
jgi:signal transduction histidine kinase